MVYPTNTSKTSDSGKTNHSNVKETSNTASTQFDPGNLSRNQQRNHHLMNPMETDERDERVDEYPNDNTATQGDTREIQSIEKRYLTIKVEFEPEREVQDDEYGAMVLQTAQDLLQAWDHDKIIEDAYNLDGQLLERRYDLLDSWAIIPKIVKRKKYISVETIVQVKTKASAYGLYQNQKDYCDQNNISIIGKRTGLAYTKKVGFLSGAYVKLASVDYHIDEIIDELKLDDKSIDIKKRFTYERNSRSKVLVIYAVHEDADEIEENLLKMKSPRYKYVSYKKTTSEERLAAMHHNDVRNNKAKFETLYDIKLKDEVWNTENSCYETLESILMKLTNENHPLFLAAEQGAGKFQKNVNVVLNPRVKKYARSWLSQEYPLLTLKEMKEMKTSVVEQNTQYDAQYSDSLKEFLAPTFTNLSNGQQKKMGKKLKTYAQALGIPSTESNNSKENDQSKNRETEERNNKSKSKNNQKENELKEVINRMKDQIEKLVQIIKMMCNTIECNEEVKKTVEDQLDEIEHVMEKENDVIQNSNAREEESNMSYGSSKNNGNEISNKCKIRPHPYSRQNSTTGGVSQKMKWIRKMQEFNLNSNSNSNKKSKPNE